MKAQFVIPRGFRRLHRNEKPKLGDIAIFGTWQVGIGVVWDEIKECQLHNDPVIYVMARKKARRSRGK